LILFYFSPKQLWYEKTEPVRVEDLQIRVLHPCLYSISADLKELYLICEIIFWQMWRRWSNEM
jgi:hypothetical protein